MANKIGIALGVNGEESFKRALRECKNEVKGYQNGIKDLDTAFKNGKATLEEYQKKQELLKEKQQAYTKTLDAAKSGLENAKKQYESHKSALDKLEKELKEAKDQQKALSDAGKEGTEEYKKASAAVEDYEEKIQKESQAVEACEKSMNTWNKEIDKAEKGVKDCDKQLDKYSKDTNTATTKTNSFSISLRDMIKNKIVGMAVDGLKQLGEKALEAAKYVVEVGSSFEAQMSKVQALSGASSQEMAKLTAVASEMGRTTKFTATEAGEGLEYMAMAGWKTEDMVNGLSGVMYLAAASGADLGTTSDIVTDALTAFGKSAEESGHLADVMAVASTNANTNVELMGETFKYAAPVAGALGYSMEDTAEAIGLMANAGIKGSQAGTSLRSIITRLSTDAGASSTSLGALGTLTEKLGVEFFNTDGSARNLNDVLTDARAVWGGLTEEEQINYANTIAGKNAMSGWLALMNASPADVAKLEGALANCDGAAQSMAATMNDNLNGKITLMNSALEGLGVALYGYISGPLQNIVSGVTEIINGITSALAPQKTELETFIDDISKSNEEVEKSIKNAQDTVGKAETKVAELESTKNFLQGVLDNCQQFSETDLSEAAAGVDTDLGTAETAFSDLNNAAGNAITKMEGVDDVAYTGDNLNEDALKGPLGELETAAGTATKAIEGTDDVKLNGEKLNETAITTPLGEIKTDAEETGEAISGISDASITDSTIKEGTNAIVTDMGEAAQAAEDAEAAIRKPGLVKAVDIKGKVPVAAEDIVEQENNIQTGAENAAKAIGNIGSNTESIKSTTEALGYMKDAQEGVVVVTDAFTKTKITNIVDKLKDTVPELAEAWNANTGELSLTNAQLLEYIKNAEDTVRTQAYAEALKELYGAMYKAEIDAEMAQSALNEAHKETNRVMAEQTEKLSSNWLQQELNYQEIEKVTGAEEDANSEYAESLELYRTSKAEAERLAEVINNLGLNIDTTTGEIIENKEATEGNTEATAQAVSQNQILIEGLAALTEQEAETTETTQGLTTAQAESVKAFQEMTRSTTEDLTAMMAEMNLSAADFAEWCQNRVDEVAEIEKAYDDLVTSVSDSLRSYVEGLDTSGEEGSRAIDNIVTNLQNRRKNLEQWVTNMKELGKMAGKEMPQALYDQLLAEGPEKTMEAVQALVDAAHDETGKFEEVADEYNKALEIEAEAAVLASYSATGKNYAAALDAGFIGSKEEYEKTVQDLINSGAITAKESTGGYGEAGQEAGAGVAGGMTDEKETVEAAAETVASAGVAAVEKADVWFKAAGGAAMNALRRGMIEIQNSPTLSPAVKAKEIVDAAIESARTEAGNFQGIGQDASYGFANGLGDWDALRRAQSAADNLGSYARGAIDWYKDSFYSVGINMAYGLADGIWYGQSAAINAAASMAKNALVTAKNVLGIRSPSKEFELVGKYSDEGMAQGFEKNKRLVEDAARESAIAARDAAQKEFSDSGYYEDLSAKITASGTEKLNEITRVKSDVAETANAIKQLTIGMTAMTGLAESLTNPLAPNITVMVGNQEFKAYIVNTAVEGMGQKQKSLMKGVGA